MRWNPLLLQLLFFVFLSIEATFNCGRKPKWSDCADEQKFLPSHHKELFVNTMIETCKMKKQEDKLYAIKKNFIMSPEYSNISGANRSNWICNIADYKKNECFEQNENVQSIAIKSICDAYLYIDKLTDLEHRKYGSSPGSLWAFAKEKKYKSCVRMENGRFVYENITGCSPALNMATLTCIVSWKMHVILGNVIPGICGKNETVIVTNRPPMTTAVPSSRATTTTVPSTASRRATPAPTAKVPSTAPSTTIKTTASPTTTKAPTPVGSSTRMTSTTTKPPTTTSSTTTSTTSASTSKPRTTTVSSTTTRMTPRSTASTSVPTSTSSDRWTTASTTSSSSSSTSETPTSTEKTSRVISPLIPVATTSKPPPRTSSIPITGNGSDIKEATAAPSESQKKDDDDKGYMLWVYIAGGVFGVVFVVVALILIVVCIKRCVKKRKISKDTGRNGKSTSSSVISNSKSVPPERKKAAPLKEVPPKTPVVPKKDPSVADLEPKHFEEMGILTVEGGIKGPIVFSEESSHSLLDAWVDDEHKVYFIGSDIEKVEESPSKMITCTEGANTVSGRTAKTTKSQNTLKRGQKKEQSEKKEEKKKIQIRTRKTHRK